MTGPDRKRVAWPRRLVILALLAVVALLWLWWAHRSSADDLSALGVRLADRIGTVEEYELDEAELFRQAGPDALPLLERALRSRDTPGYARVYDWIVPRMRFWPLTAVVKLVPEPVRDAERLRTGAARMLEAIGEDAAPARQALLRALDDEAAGVNWHASMALLRLGGSTQAVVASQRRWLMKPAAGHATAAAIVLARVGPQARGEVPLLLSALSARTNIEDQVGLFCLPWTLPDSPLDPPAHSFGELLKRAPRHPRDADVWRRIDAAVEPVRAEIFGTRDPGQGTNGPATGLDEIDAEMVLGLMYLGPICSNVVPILKLQLASSDSEKRLLAALAWWHVTGDRLGSARVLATTGRPDDAVVQLAFLLTLHDLGAAAAPAATNAAGYLSSTNALFRRIATRVLGQAGEAGRFALPELERSLGDPCLGVRLDAAEAIWTLTRNARSVLSALVPMLEDRSPRRRGQAARLLVMMGEAAVPPDTLNRARAAPATAPDPIPSVFEVEVRMLGSAE
jgi:HEAT repeat protein